MNDVKVAASLKYSNNHHLGLHNIYNIDATLLKKTKEICKTKCIKFVNEKL